MTTISDAIIDQAGGGEVLGDIQAIALASHDDLELLMEAARARRDLAHGNRISYSPKVFIPLLHSGLPGPKGGCDKVGPSRAPGAQAPGADKSTTHLPRPHKIC